MGPREHYKTPEEDVVALSNQVLQLFRQALPDPGDRDLFNRWMNEANSLGLSWIEGLKYAAERREMIYRS